MAKFPVDAPIDKVIKTFEKLGSASFGKVTTLPCFVKIQITPERRLPCPIIAR